jgi:hypothetical protein
MHQEIEDAAASAVGVEIAGAEIAGAEIADAETADADVAEGAGAVVATRKTSGCL